MYKLITWISKMFIYNLDTLVLIIFQVSCVTLSRPICQVIFTCFSAFWKLVIFPYPYPCASSFLFIPRTCVLRLTKQRPYFFVPRLILLSRILLLQLKVETTTKLRTRHELFRIFQSSLCTTFTKYQHSDSTL